MSDETMEMLRGFLEEDAPHHMPVPAAPRLPGQPGYRHSTFSLSSSEWEVDEAEASKLRQERHRRDIMKEQTMKEHVLAERRRYRAKRKADHEAQAEEEALKREKLLLSHLQERAHQREMTEDIFWLERIRMARKLGHDAFHEVNMRETSVAVPGYFVPTGYTESEFQHCDPKYDAPSRYGTAYACGWNAYSAFQEGIPATCIDLKDDGTQEKHEVRLHIGPQTLCMTETVVEHTSVGSMETQRRWHSDGNMEMQQCKRSKRMLAFVSTEFTVERQQDTNMSSDVSTTDDDDEPH
ncbi:hypothetical protein N9L68_04090 [bacterium]|nr:hypothetical protein [bacterium]